MHRLFALTRFLIGLLLLLIATPSRADDVLSIRHVTVIDPESMSVKHRQRVTIRHGKITALSADNATALGQNEIDGQHKFLIPGLIDMHVHTALGHFSDSSLRLQLLNGVTGIREMSGDCWVTPSVYACIEQYRQLQRDLDAGKMLGPRLLSIASAFVKHPNSAQLPASAPGYFAPTTGAQAAQLVAYLKPRGVDLIKSYDDMPADAYYALLAAAKSAGIEVSGHVPYVADVVTAVQHGHRSIEHAQSIPLDCSDYAAQFHQIVQATLAGDKTVKWPSDAERLRFTIDGFNPGKCASLLRELKQHNAYYVPTHMTREMEARASDTAYQHNVHLNYVMPALKAMWQPDLQKTANANDEMRKQYRRFFDHGLMITRLAHEAGVAIMLGTDSNDTMVIPGFSVHSEMQHLHKAGLKPMDVLRAATTIPARYVGQQNEMGGIAVGKRADLVLLTADPLLDIRNTGAIDSVIINGRVYDQNQRTTLLQQIAAQASAAPKSVTVAATLLQEYEGRYVVPSSQLPITIKATADSISATAPGMPVINFLAESDTLFFMKEDLTKFEFLRVDGKINALRVLWANGKSEIAARQ